MMLGSRFRSVSALLGAPFAGVGIREFLFVVLFDTLHLSLIGTTGTVVRGQRRSIWSSPSSSFPYERPG